jgi:hypothetical protein
MPSWFWGDLLSLKNAVIIGAIFLVYTTITGTGGFLLHSGINLALKHNWGRASAQGLYSLVVTVGLLILMIILFPGSTHRLTSWLEWAALPTPYVLGYFGQFIIPGDWGE